MWKEGIGRHGLVWYTYSALVLVHKLVFNLKKLLYPGNHCVTQKKVNVLFFSPTLYQPIGKRWTPLTSPNPRLLIQRRHTLISTFANILCPYGVHFPQCKASSKSTGKLIAFHWVWWRYYLLDYCRETPLGVSVCCPILVALTQAYWFLSQYINWPGL